jgi:hypothetical protein
MRYLLLALLLFACSKSDDPIPAMHSEERRAQIEANGVEANAKSLLTGKFRSPCDDAVEPIRQEIAHALEVHRGEIAAFQARQSDANYRVVPFGPTFARERLTPAAAKPGWLEVRTSWKGYAADYAALKDSPVDARWVALNMNVRGTLTDEVDRIVDGVNVQVDENSEPGLARLITELEACTSDVMCELPSFSPDSLAFLAGMPRLQQHFDSVKNASTHEGKRKFIQTFLAWVRADHHRFEFIPNPLVRVTSPGHYVLPIDPGPFADSADQLHRYVEGVWSADGKQITLELGAREGAYRIVLGNESGGRSWVSRADKTVHLNPFVRAKSVAHELGHVLGFGDNYYDIFEPATCEWRSRWRDDDIMSQIPSGGALPSHWDALEKNYRP